MSLISSSIPNLVNGVSQQPPTLRLTSQAEAQENGISTVAKGLKKRPPTRHIAKLSETPLTGAYLHTINRDQNEKYIVAITSGALRVWDLAGNELTVNTPDGTAYLNTSNAKTAFRTVTVADYTFIVNKEVKVQKAATLTTSRPYEGLINVTAGNYGKTYSVKVDGVQRAAFTTRDGADKSHVVDIDTDTIASNLYNGLVASGYSCQLFGSVIYISSTTDFSLEVLDGFNNGAAVAIKGNIQRFSDLPPSGGVNGFTIEVAGDANSGFDNYWVKYVLEDNASGLWKEAVQPGISDGLEDSSMPHALVREADGTFTFKELQWGKRNAGDETSAPDPSFVDRTISDVFFYRNRLGFLSEDSVIFSEASEFFNFYNPTATALLDSAPIDASVSHTKVSTLVHAVPFSKQLLLFSSQTQFVVESGDLLTPKTISIKQTTEFECNTAAKPIGVGNVVYFAVPRGDYAGVREFFVDSNTGTNDALDITAHVPTYIPQGVERIVAGLNEDILVALTPYDPTSLYIYKFYWNNSQKLQSSWSKWVFGGDVLNIDFIESTMYLVINRADGTYIESMNVAAQNTPDTLEPYIVHFDRKAYATTLGYVDGKTYLQLPYVPQGSIKAVAATDSGTQAGSYFDVLSDGGGFYVNGNWSDKTMVVGEPYNLKYTFTTISIKRQQGDAQVADQSGRLQLRNMRINYADSGYFKVSVVNKGRQPFEYVFTGATLGDASATLGATAIKTGVFKFPIMARSENVTIEVLSDSPKPVSLLNAEWEGFYVRRSQPA
jgi:hypothetical protein